MILVRSRGAFFEAMIRALKENDIAAAGADRLMLRNSSGGRWTSPPPAAPRCGPKTT